MREFFTSQDEEIEMLSAKKKIRRPVFCLRVQWLVRWRLAITRPIHKILKTDPRDHGLN
jgi:hypothetical protein